MAKIIVTGGAGMIGSNLTKRLVKDGHEVIVIDNLWRGKLDNLFDTEKRRYVIDIEKQFFKLDLSKDIDNIEPFKDTDFIFHLADVVAGIDYVFNNQSNLFRQNLLINTNTIDLAKKLKIKGYIYSATACSFPAELQNSFDYKLLKEDELYPANPESAYGWSKLMGIYEAELLEKETNIKTLSLILHNVYGAPCDYQEPRSQVIPALIRKAINFPNEDFIVWGSGKQGRAFIHVDDVVEAFILGLEKGLGKGIIQIGPDFSTTIKEIAETIVSISGRDIHIKYDTNKPEGDKARAADYSIAKSILDWEPSVSLEMGLKDLFTWIQLDQKANK